MSSSGGIETQGILGNEATKNFDMQTAGEKRLLQLNEMEEFHNNGYENAKIYKERTKR